MVQDNTRAIISAMRKLITAAPEEERYRLGRAISSHCASKFPHAELMDAIIEATETRPYHPGGWPWRNPV